MLADMIELVVASNSKGKIAEIRSVVQNIALLSLEDIGFAAEIEEPFQTFEENALEKAEVIHNFSGKNVFSDDSGICVNALNDAPGVNSAFFGGLPRSDEKNNNRLLRELHGKDDRSAFYKAVICLIWKGQAYFFEGVCRGRIATSPTGHEGFGYDPLFIPEGYDQTFGELPPNVKNQLSHRGIALRKMLTFLDDHIHQS
jgi:XTP/dITP diphosphohydrolase